MKLNLVFEFSMTLISNEFQKIFDRACSKSIYLEELENDEYADHSLSEKGIIFIYRESQYKKKIRLIVNTHLLLNGEDDIGKLSHKLGKRIAEYFNYKYHLDDFILSGMNLIGDIDVGSRDNVLSYLRVLRRVGKVKGFSPTSYDGIDENSSFCLCGNSNAIDFLLYDLEQTVVGHLLDNDIGHKKITSTSGHTQGILRAEVKLTKPKAVRAYTNAEDTAGQIVELITDRQEIFLDTFAQAVPFGDFYKKDAAVEIIWKEIKDAIMRRRMLRLLTLIPEKKSLLLAQKAMNCREVEKVMMAFAKINLSPVTLSKRSDIKKLGNLYSYLI